VALADANALADGFTAGSATATVLVSTTTAGSGADCVAHARVSAWMTELLHTAPGETESDRKLRLARLRQLTESRRSAAAFVERYLGT